MPEEVKSASTLKTDKPDIESKKADRPELDGSKIHVKLYSPFKVYYDAEAASMSAENDTGPFDILPRHHNFITLLNAGEVVIRPLDGAKEVNISITRGVMHIRNNNVTVFLDV